LARPPAHLAVDLLFQINARRLHGHSLNRRPLRRNRQYRPVPTPKSGGTLTVGLPAPRSGGSANRS
jgi:hypothetical protein